MSHSGNKRRVNDNNKASDGDCSSAEPIAIIGMGCRFPGAPDPESLWRVLSERVDCVAEIPRDRFPELDDFYDPTPGVPGKVITRKGGYLDRIDGFDPYFFGVSPREATFMDPQQRLLLEVGWEALEDAGLPIESLAGSRTGVYVGLWTSEYETEMFRATSEIDLYMTTGGSRYGAAGRMSYVFDLQGPSLVADTACSTSLVTAHLACQAIRMGEADLALAGGVNLILQPPITIAFSKAKMLSPDGRCKFGDADANGYVRSEGCGVVVLKRLSKAIEDGDRIYATILGSAVNSDGQEGFFVAPAQSGQEKMLHEAYRAAGRSPGDVTYVEAHGTGTGVGDPTELHALGAVLKQGRPEDRPAIVGTVKTNIGHTESAAGVAGMIKAAMCLQRREVQPTLHLNEPNPGIAWDELPLRLPTEAEPLPDYGKPALAGVNSFGISGTNAHVVMEEPPRDLPEPEKPERQGAFLLPLSARSRESLADLAMRWSEFLGSSNESLHDICFTAGARRSHHDWRLAVSGGDANDLLEALQVAGQADAINESEMSDDGGESAASPTGPVFVFSGQGPQWWAMGRRLAENEPVYRNMIEQIDALARPMVGWSLLDELNADESESRLDDTEICQPALFALQMGLDALWRSWGIEPSAIVGHSVGEVAAACSAGVLSLESAVRVVTSRGRLMQDATGLGKMAAAELTLDEAQKIVAAHDGRVGVAAVNSPGAVTLSGEADALALIAAEMEDSGKFFRMLDVTLAAHSPQVEPSAIALVDELAGIETMSPKTPLVSTVTGAFAEKGDYGPDYWRKNVRQTVQFERAISLLADAGHKTFLELAPHPALTYSVSQCLSHHGVSGVCVGSLRSDEDEGQSIMAALGRLYESGCHMNWGDVYPQGGRCVTLPSYAWQRERFWFEPGEGSGIVDRSGPRAALRDGGGSGLGYAQHSADMPGRFYWEKPVAADSPAYLRDHVVEETVTYPAAAYLEGALAAAHDAFGAGDHELVGMKFERALSFGEDDCRVLQTALAYDTPGTVGCRFYSRDVDADSGQDDWTLHAHGSIWLDGTENAQTKSVPTLAELTRQSDAAVYDHHTDMADRGLNYGPAFRGVDDAWRGDGWAAARLHVPTETDWIQRDYRANPGVWDAGFQLLVSLVGKSDSSRHDVFLPVGIENVCRRVAFAEADGLWAIATVKRRTDEFVEGDIDFLDAAGEIVASATGMRLLRLERTGHGHMRDWLYEIQWQPLETNASASSAPSNTQKTPVPKISVCDLADRMREQVRTDDLCQEGARAAELNPQLDRLCGAYAQQALRTLGWRLEPGKAASAASLGSDLGVVESQHRMFGRILEFLAEDGVLEREDGGWKALTGLTETKPSEIWQDLHDRFAEFRAELELLGTCGEAMADVFRGDCDPLELLFSEASAPALEHLYQDAPMLRGPNELAREAIATLVESWPADKPIRVFEIGAGTGGTTKRILNELPADRTEYVFTDLSHYFLEKAKRKFPDCPFLDPKIFDVEKDPAEQGVTPGSFDVVLASNVLHATPDLEATLRNARRLLSPGGVLILVEGNQPARMVDTIFGLTEGWWKFNDRDLRPSHPLLSTDTWYEALGNTGFEEFSSVTNVDAFGGGVFPQAVIVASASDSVQAQPSQDWLIFADAGGTGEALAAALREQGATCHVALAGEDYAAEGDDRYRINPASEEHVKQLVGQTLADAGRTPPLVVHMWALDAPQEFSYSGDDAEAVQERLCGSALYLAKALAAREGQTAASLWFVTRGAQPVGDTTPNLAPSQAALWGFAKVVGLEHPELSPRLLDLDPGEDAADGDDLARILTSTLGEKPERWLATRGEQLFGARLSRANVTEAGVSERLDVPVNRAYELQISERGALDNVVLAPVGRHAPGPGEVEMQVLATGQNFRDIFNLLGMGEVLRMGLECSGVVTAVGDGVEEFRVGDPVMALAMASFASYATAPVDMVAPKPEYFSYEQAAAVPVVFLTVHFALRELAKIKSGDSVLIHAASGGVGMAAVQIALAAGATVFGTAGSPAKRATVEAMGAHHVMDSRSLEFAEQILELTQGRGVDIVLNCLAGDFIQKSFEVLADDGTFVEIGKSGVWTEEQAHAVKKECSYHVLDLPTWMRNRPRKVGAAFRHLLTEFEAGLLTPAPIQTFPIEDIITAFRTMSQAKHIGKIVITQNDPRVGEGDAGLPDFRADGSYLITGGLGGLGLLVAKWMVDHGARHLVLSGRSAPSAQAASAIEDLRNRGATVTTPMADVSVTDEVAQLLSDIPSDHPALIGILHCAGVLEDGVLSQQTWDRTWKVFAPKLAGATNLHELTRGMQLETFILFSSWCSVLGSAGQANHSAANAFLDTLAHYRRAQGLPAMSINWGAWTEIGAAAQGGRSDSLGRQGIGNFTPAEGIDALEHLLAQGAIQSAVVPFDLERWRQVDTLGDQSRLFDLLAEETEADSAASDAATDNIRHALEAAQPGSQRRDVMEDHLRIQVAQVLRLPAARIDRGKSFKDLGLDSLTGLELRNRLETSLELSLPATLVWNYPSIAKLARFLAERMGTPLDEDAGAAEDGTDAEPLDSLLQELESLSDEEAAEVLKATAEVAGADD